MPELLTDPVRIGVSACLDRSPVRYNGRSFDALAVLGRERGAFSVTPVCPECMAGLGVPRTPVHLTGTTEEVLAGEAHVRDKRGRDVTREVVAGARACVEALERAGVEAVILKESSPSCGLYLARIGGHRRQATGAGVFGAMARQHDWFLIPDSALQSPLKWWDWRRRLHAWLWLRRRELSSIRDVYETWHVLKFLVQELDRPIADSIGHDLAGRPFTPEAAEEFRARVGDVLRCPSTLPRIRQAMWKSYAVLRRSGKLDGVALGDLTVDSPEVRRNQAAIAEELLGMEKVSYQNELLFGATPVLARSGPYVPRDVRRAEREDRTRAHR